MPAEWGPFIETVRDRLCRGERVTMTVDEIVAATRSGDPAVRERWFWRAAQLGAQEFEGFAEAGVRLEFSPDVRGRDVETVTFYR